MPRYWRPDSPRDDDPGGSCPEEDHYDGCGPRRRHDSRGSAIVGGPDSESSS